MSASRCPIGTRVMAIREHRGMTQTELAERAGTTQGAISMIESGDRNPSWDMLERLANALGARLSFAIKPPILHERCRPDHSGRGLPVERGPMNDPNIIYLEPYPGSPDGRMWCEDPVWDEIPECEGQSVRYVREDLVLEVREALRRLVNACSPSATSVSEKTGRPYGVRMPEKEIVEACRDLLSTTGSDRG